MHHPVIGRNPKALITQLPPPIRTIFAERDRAKLSSSLGSVCWEKGILYNVVTKIPSSRVRRAAGRPHMLRTLAQHAHHAHHERRPRRRVDTCASCPACARWELRGPIPMLHRTTQQRDGQVEYDRWRPHSHINAQARDWRWRATPHPKPTTGESRSTRTRHNLASCKFLPPRDHRLQSYQVGPPTCRDHKPRSGHVTAASPSALAEQWVGAHTLRVVEG